MAKIIKKEMHLEKEFIFYQNQIKKKILYTVLLFGIGIISGAFFLCINQTILLFAPLIFGIIAMGLLVSIAPLKNEMDILQAGIDGENLANRCIALLPESYTAFRNLTIQYKDKNSEMDMLIIGPTGVFVIETKNLNGSIYGNIKDTRWVQHKVGRAGTPYAKTFYSPVKQVNTHVYRIANYLRENGIHTYINAVVYFSNVNTTVEIFGTGEKTPLFFAKNDGANQMLHHILNNNQQLSQDECDKIVNLLKNT